MLVFCLQANASIFSQSRINVELKNSKLEDLIKIIEEQTEMGFLYDASEISGVKAISVSFDNETIETVLTKALEGTGLGFEVDHKTILIKPLLENKATQQDVRQIKGTVVDDIKLPLPGVSVVVKGTTNGVSTDFDGNYSLEIPATGRVVLVYTFIGMEPQEIVVTNQTTIDVVLKGSSEQLAEVTVTTGYQTIDRKLFTGSATVLKAEDATVAGVADVGRMLEGKVAGVSVQNVSGTFGAAPKIRIRGASSIYGDTKPLWVVDGVVLEDVVDISPDQLSSGDASTLISSSVAGINADDIESFQILKDASATALYGARAMNGVIVITTKKGHTGKNSIRVTSEFTMKMKPSYGNYDILNSQDQMGMFMEMKENGWLTYADVMRSKDAGVFHKMYSLIESYEDGKYGLEHTDEAMSGFFTQI
jgi:TonB-dependent SusC/RagA subfamily outer membrane receptor